MDTAWEFCVPVMENFIPANIVWHAIATKHDTAWEFCVPVMENFIPANIVWHAIATKHD